MLSVADARSRIEAAFKPLSSEQVGLTEALGRVLAEDGAARVTQPPVAVSAMDGYAVRAADLSTTPARLRLVGSIAAGSGGDVAVGPGEAARIFTGAPLPRGADTIVIQENAAREGDHVVVREGAAKGRFVRGAGLDFSVGDVLLRRGRLLTARDIGMAAAMNLPWLKVSRRPRIAILSTGDEIVLPGDPIGKSQIVGSNGFALAAFATACGAEPIQLGISRDEKQALQRLAEAAESADLLVTSGGVSVGEHDLVRQALGEIGMAVDFWRVAIRPGKPLMFGKVGGTPVLGVPGNPVSALVCATIFLRPAIHVMLGRIGDLDGPDAALLGCDLAANDERQDYLRSRLSRDDQGRLLATPFPQQDSSMLSLMASADCLVIRPPFAPPIKAGAPVPILPLAGGALSI